MRTRTLLLLLLLSLPLSAADALLNGQVQLSVQNLTGQQALNLRDKVLTYWQSNELARFNNWENHEWQVQTNSTEQGTRYDVNLQIATIATNAAERIYSNLVNRTSIPTNVTGLISIHYCPINPTNDGVWAGCDRTNPPYLYRFKVIP